LMLCLYLSAPYFEWSRINAFFISLPSAVIEEEMSFIAGGLIFVWVWGFIALLILLNWTGKNYLSSVSIFAFNRERMFRSFIWSAIFGYFFFNEVFLAVNNSLHFRFFEVFQGLALAYVLLCLRTLIVFKKE